VELIRNSGLRKFRHGISIVERAINLARQRWRRSERDKLDRRRSTKLTIPPSSDARPLQFITTIVRLCLQHDFVAADSFFVIVDNLLTVGGYAVTLLTAWGFLLVLCSCRTGGSIAEWLACWTQA